MDFSHSNIFESFDYNDFKKNFLTEKALDKTSPLPLGELSKEMSKVNIGLANTLNKWAAEISSKVNRYVKRLKRRPEGVSNISVRSIPIGDKKGGDAAIIVIMIEDIGEVEISIIDSNRVIVTMSQFIANSVNKGRMRKFLPNKDKVSDYLIGILEKMA